ncbi:hypothetical protein RclHR1_06830007 [Rhizophagus clarus]|uniref:Myb-like domain-containing protein n=1 Tax=Rhizophagus clarus TaxID=94130 RepID=A0A2Z6SJY7_9GLOM|nr:hypothetical protein RclHR1_06830007 [Rhizophagus clarus]GES76121.1 hypothetical protein GLOIN_2v1781841 [Rhizophagus clarus]
MKQESQSVYLISEQDSKNCSKSSSSSSVSSIPYVILIDESDSNNDSKSKVNSSSNDFVRKNKKDRFCANKFSSQSSTSSSSTSLPSISDYSSTVKKEDNNSSIIKKEECTDNKKFNCNPIKIESSDDDDVKIINQDSKADLKVIEVEDESDDSVGFGRHKRSAASKKRKPKKIWNSTDIELLFDGIELYGSKWNKVASHVGNDFRSIQCKRRWEIIKRQFIRQNYEKKGIIN